MLCPYNGSRPDCAGECISLVVSVSVDYRELGEVGGIVVGYAKDEQSAIVGWRCARAAVVVGGAEDVGGDGIGRLIGRNAGKYRTETICAEFFQFVIEGFENTVGGEAPASAASRPSKNGIHC